MSRKARTPEEEEVLVDRARIIARARVQARKEIEREFDDVKHLQARNRRLLEAFLALRDVKQVGVDMEPIVLWVTRELQKMAHKIAKDCNEKQSRMAERVIRAETRRIILTMERRCDELQESAQSPNYARYIEAQAKLHAGDLDEEVV